MKKFKTNELGITLVGLVVTIILLLILAGITISQLSGSGLFENAKLAEQKTKNVQELEDATLKDYENKIGEYINNNRDTTIESGINYSSQEVKTNNIWFGKPIYTKTIYIDSLPNATSNTYNHGIENVDMIWFDSSNSFAIWSNGNVGVMPFAADNVNFIGLHGANKTQFGITTATDRTSLAAYITLKYTKTTD